MAIRTIASAGALIWYAKANYASPPFVIEEFGFHEFLDQNLKILFAAGDEALKNGPPQCVLDELARPPRDHKGRAPKESREPKERKEPKEPQHSQEQQESLEPKEPEKPHEPEKPKRIPSASELNAASKTWPEPGSVSRPKDDSLHISYDGVRAVEVYRAVNVLHPTKERWDVQWRYAVHPGVGYHLQTVGYNLPNFEEAEAMGWREVANPSIDVVRKLPLVGSLLAAVPPAPAVPSAALSSALRRSPS